MPGPTKEFRQQTTNHLFALQGQTFMVIGAAGELPKAPEKPIVFLEGAAVECGQFCETY